MFRITRGMHVQHVHFPFPMLRPRDLDDAVDDDERVGADPPESAAPPAAENVAEPASDQQ